MSTCTTFVKWLNIPTNVLDWLAPLGDLFVRFWVAKIFFMSALTKLQSWHATINLFTHEYNVPLLPPEFAAYFGTASELVLPILILLGFGTRLPAVLLFIFNLTAVVSYPFLWTEAGERGLEHHFYWGILIGYIMLHGYGKISVDYWIKQYKCNELKV